MFMFSIKQSYIVVQNVDFVYLYHLFYSMNFNQNYKGDRRIK